MYAETNINNVADTNVIAVISNHFNIAYDLLCIFMDFYNKLNNLNLNQIHIYLCSTCLLYHINVSEQKNDISYFA